MPPTKDISNRFLGIEIWVPFAILAVGGFVSYGSLSADVKHKADKSDIAVIATKVETIAEDVSENKTDIKAFGKVIVENQILLREIKASLDND